MRYVGHRLRKEVPRQEANVLREHRHDRLLAEARLLGGQIPGRRTKGECEGNGKPVERLAAGGHDRVDLKRPLERLPGVCCDDRRVVMLRSEWDDLPECRRFWRYDRVVRAPLSALGQASVLRGRARWARASRFAGRLAANSNR